MRDGVEVFTLTKDPASGHEEKHSLGKSSKAGQTAVMQSAASRVFTNVSVSQTVCAIFIPFLDIDADRWW